MTTKSVFALAAILALGGLSLPTNASAANGGGGHGGGHGGGGGLGGGGPAAGRGHVRGHNFGGHPVAAAWPPAPGFGRDRPPAPPAPRAPSPALRAGVNPPT